RQTSATQPLSFSADAAPKTSKRIGHAVASDARGCQASWTEASAAFQIQTQKGPPAIATQKNTVDACRDGQESTSTKQNQRRRAFNACDSKISAWATESEANVDALGGCLKQ